MKNGNKNNCEQGKSEGSWVNEVVRAGVMSTQCNRSHKHTQNI